MKELLDKLSVEMNRVNPKGFARFGQGLSLEEIEKKLKGFPIPFSKFSDLIELLKWRNGVVENPDDRVDAVLIPGYMLMGLDEIIIRYEQFCDFPIISGKYWVPFLHDFSNGGYYYDVRDKCIISLIPEVGEGLRFKSMANFLTAVYECYKDNIYFLDSGVYLDADRKKEDIVLLSYAETFILGDEDGGL